MASARFDIHMLQSVSHWKVADDIFPEIANEGRAQDMVVNGEITRQALFIAYLDDFKLMMLVTFAVLPLLFLMRKSQPAGSRQHVAMD